MAEVDVSGAAWDSAQAEIDAQGGPSADLDWQAVAEGAAAGAAAAACAAYGLAAAAPLCAYVGGEVAGFVVNEVIPAIGDAWDSIFGSEPETSLIGPMSDEQKWLGSWQTISGDIATRIPLEHAIDAVLRAAVALAPGAWTTETVLGWLRDCGAELEWRAVDIDNRQFSGWRTTATQPEGPDGPIVYEERPVFATVPGRPKLSQAWWLPDWPKQFRELYPFDNTWQTLQAFIGAHVRPWWDNLYNRALPCLSARLQADAIALAANLAALEFRSQQLAELAALPAGDREALRQWAELAALPPEEAQRLRDWAALAALSETEREQLRALKAFGELGPAELARIQTIGAVTRGRNFGRFGAFVAAPIGAA